jgi:glutaredoxin 3
MYKCDGDSCVLIDSIDNIDNTSTNSIHSIPLPLISSADSNSITVYGASWCKYCNDAKKLLEEYSKELGTCNYVDIEEYTTTTKFKEFMANRTNSYKTIPMIFRGDEFIGGYSDLLNICNNFNKVTKVTKVNKIIIHPVKNGPDDFTEPVSFEINIDGGPTINYTQTPNAITIIECEPFVYDTNKSVNGKLYAFDRTVESKNYFTLYLSGGHKLDNSDEINVHVRVHGPFIAFSLMFC